MAKKTNFNTNDYEYYRVNAVIGRNPDGTYIRKQFYGLSKKEAEAKKKEFLDNINNGLNVDYREMTIEKFMKLWLFNVVRVDKSFSTFDRYESVYRNYIVGSQLACLKVYEVKPLFLKGYYNAMAENGYSSSKIYNLNKLLKIFFNYAITEGYLLKNPCFGISIPKDVKADGEDAARIEPFSDDEIKAITETAKGSMKTIFQFGLATGLRRGELLGLQVKNVNFETMTVDICQALKDVKKFSNDNEYEYLTILEKPKTPGSIRSVPLPTSLKAILKQHLVQEKEKHLMLGIRHTQDSLFFTSEACSPYNGRNIGTAFKRLLKRAGVRYRCFHNVRHTYATKLFEARVPLLTISKLLGHSNINITANTYVSIMPKEKSAAAEELNYLFA